MSEKKVSKAKILKDGIIDNNPVLVQTVGLCSALGMSSTIVGGLGMGIALTLVLIGSNVVISLLKNFIPDEIRIPSFIVVIATFVTALELVIEAYFPDLYQTMGVFLALIVVNCIILARAETFASSNGVFYSLLDGLANGLGYTLVLVVTAFFRELLGSGSLFGISIIPEEYTISFFQSPAAAFLCLGLLMMLMNSYKDKQRKKAILKRVQEKKARSEK